MRVLIIALPRTGSTSLLRQIADERNLRPFFEPFSLKKNYFLDSKMKNIVVKTIIHHHHDNFSLAKDFDEVILLSRRNHKEHLESYSFLMNNIPQGYNSNEYYNYITPPNHIIKRANRKLLEMSAELKLLSNQLSIPIQYYEDLFDKNSGDRLRKKKDEFKNFI